MPRALSYRKIGTEQYGIWESEILVPFHPKNHPNELKFFPRDVDFEEAEAYWEYTSDGDNTWSVYRVRRGKDRKMIAYNVQKKDVHSIIRLLYEGEITGRDARLYEQKTRAVGERIPIAGVKWSEEWDGRPILLLLGAKPKMSFAEVMNVILNEKGTVDSCGIIHKAQ